MYIFRSICEKLHNKVVRIPRSLFSCRIMISFIEKYRGTSQRMYDNGFCSVDLIRSLVFIQRDIAHFVLVFFYNVVNTVDTDIWGHILGIKIVPTTLNIWKLKLEFHLRLRFGLHDRLYHECLSCKMKFLLGYSWTAKMWSLTKRHKNKFSFNVGNALVVAITFAANVDRQRSQRSNVMQVSPAGSNLQD